MSDLEAALALQIRALRLPEPEREHRFAALAAGGTGKGLRARLRTAGLKDWRFDFAWPSKMLAVEVEGGIWVSGRHNRGGGMEEDCRKYGRAMTLGWSVYRTTGGLITSGEAVQIIEALLRDR